MGGGAGVYEGVCVQTRAVLAAGVILTASSVLFDLVHEKEYRSTPERPLVVPEGAVVVMGARPAPGLVGKVPRPLSRGARDREVPRREDGRADRARVGSAVSVARRIRLTASMALSSGSKLGPYEILSLLGAGGMGVVYRARDPRLSREVAVKVLPGDFLEGEERRERFEREAKLLAALNHPNIAAVYSFEESEGAIRPRHGAARGRDAARAPPARALLEPREALDAAAQVARGLGGGAREGDRPPRREARERLRDEGRAREGPRLRPREGAARAETEAPTAARPHAARGRPRDRLVHVARAAARRLERRRAQRRLLARRRPLRAPVGQAAVRRAERGRDGVAHPVRGAPLLWRREDSSRRPRRKRSSGGRCARSPKPGSRTARRSRRRSRDARDEIDFQSRLAKGGARAALARPHGSPSPRSSWPRPLAGAWIWTRRPAASGPATRCRARPASPRRESGPRHSISCERARRELPDDAGARRALSGGHGRPLGNARAARRPRPPAPLRARGRPRRRHGTRARPHAAEGRRDRPRRLRPAPREGRVRTVRADDLERDRAHGPAVHVRRDHGRVEDAEGRDGSPASVFVPAGTYKLVGYGQPTAASVPLREYLIDRYEVSNREFAEFVSAGGYRNRALWTRRSPARTGAASGGRTGCGVSSTAPACPGRAAGPGGTFPDGKAEHPVSGVSWYEASAYARFRGKTLPTIFQWEKAARDGVFTVTGEIVMPWGLQRGADARANFDGKGTVPVRQGAFGMGPFGCYHMAGNVSEWTRNAAPGGFVTAGGAYTDPPYLFGDYGIYPGLGSSERIGFRCALAAPGPARRATLRSRAPSRRPRTRARPRSVRDVARPLPLRPRAARRARRGARRDAGMDARTGELRRGRARASRRGSTCRRARARRSRSSSSFRRRTRIRASPSHRSPRATGLRPS